MQHLDFILGEEQKYVSVSLRQLARHQVALAQILFEGNICVGGAVKSPIYRPSSPPSCARDERKCCNHSSRL